MESTIQILLILMVLLLGTTLTIVGIQFFFILREVKANMAKINQILDDLLSISDEASKGIEQVSEIVGKATNALNVFNVGRVIWEVISGSRTEEEE